MSGTCLPAATVLRKSRRRPKINKRKGRTVMDMEFKKEKVYTPLAATPTHNVSQAVKYGNLVFVSGMVGEDENEVLKEGLEAQCEQAFINMKNVLEAAGSSLEKVLFCQIFIARREDRAIANEVWDRFFLNMDVGPARYTVVAPTVAEPYLFEITCIAGV